MQSIYKWEKWYILLCNIQMIKHHFILSIPDIYPSFQIILSIFMVIICYVERNITGIYKNTYTKIKEYFIIHYILRRVPKT